MADNKKIITSVQELSIVRQDVNLNKIKNALLNNDTSELEKQLAIISKLSEKEVDRRAINKDIYKFIEEQNKLIKQTTNKDSPTHLAALKRIRTVNNEITGQLDKQAALLKRGKNLYDAIGKSLDYIVKQNQEIYKTSHAMQLEGNITWRQFRQLYDGAYQSARQLNAEIGKQLYTAKELVATQEKMISTGWKGLSPESLVNVTNSMALLQRTLGDLDARLVNAFQISYNQFGAQTDLFITKMGNNLNAFSNSFGLSVATLQGAVAEMLDVNTFIARNNLEAQISANTSFMQAAALSSGLNMQNINFMGQLGRTSEFGTMSELADIYSSGAILSGFDTSSFISGLQSGEYFDQSKNLITSIRDTLGGMEDNRLLRNEYMRMLQSGFGLSQGDLIAIMNAGDNIDELEKQINEKLLNSTNSMVDELKDLHMTVADQIENFWANSRTSQALGGIMNELGLYGINGMLKIITGILVADKAGGLLKGLTGNMLGGSGVMANMGIAGGTQVPYFGGLIGGNLTGAQAMGLGLGGLAVGAMGKQLGTSIQTNPNASNADAVGGAILNALGQTAGGAMMGGAIGGIPGAIIGGAIGLGKGIFDASQADKQRQNALEELDAQSRRDIRASQVASTGDPVIDTLNNGFSNVVNAITGEGEKTRTLTTVVDLIDKGSTKTSIIGGK